MNYRPGRREIAINEQEPNWLIGLRNAARHRPKTAFQRIQWAHLQRLLREYDMLWQAASEDTRALIKVSRRAEEG